MYLACVVGDGAESNLRRNLGQGNDGVGPSATTRGTPDRNGGAYDLAATRSLV
jgi:hypothetical protein